MARKRDLTSLRSFVPDVNVQAYRSEDDGRNAERVQYVPLRAIHESPNQTRLVLDPEADHALGEDLDANGIVHPPVVRPHPLIANEFETVVGHRRIGQSWRLAKEGRGLSYLRGLAVTPGDWRMPVIVQDLDDIAALMRTVGENLFRQDLRPWEQTRALMRQETVLKANGHESSVRKLAATLDLRPGTIGAYLRVGRALSEDVIHAARLDDLGSGGPDRLLCDLSLEALLRVARRNDIAERAATLRRELKRARRVPNDASEVGSCPGPRAHGGTDAGFQINIRRPLHELTSHQAMQYLSRVAPVALALAERAGDVEAAGALPHLRAAVTALSIGE